MFNLKEKRTELFEKRMGKSLNFKCLFDEIEEQDKEFIRLRDELDTKLGLKEITVEEYLKRRDKLSGFKDE